jgi:hypothetical protein
LRATVVVAAALLAGCTTSEAGVPSPAEHNESTASSQEPVSLGDLKPCELLSSGDRQEIGLVEGLELDADTCDWSLESSSSGVSLDLYPEAGIDSVPERGSPVDLGTNYDAYELKAPGGGEGACVIMLDISENSYLMLTATSGTDTEAACELAAKVAERVDASLS